MTFSGSKHHAFWPSRGFTPRFGRRGGCPNLPNNTTHVPLCGSRGNQLVQNRRKVAFPRPWPLRDPIFGCPKLQIGQCHQSPPVFLMLVIRGLELVQQQLLLAKAEEMLNGLITNDKFCMVRSGILKLSHCRRPNRLRNQATLEYSAQEGMCGGKDETPVAKTANATGARGWPESLGTRLSPGFGDCANDQPQTSRRPSGGEPCE